jgi:hypothetical protein
MTNDKCVLSDKLKLHRLHSNIRKKKRAQLRNKED